MDERERKVQREGPQRFGGEAPLRALVLALADAVDFETIARLAADAAVEMTRACGAYVEQVVTADGEVEVVATSGDGVPPLRTRVPYPGSLTEEAIARGDPALLAGLRELGTRMTPYLIERCRTCSGIVVPLIPEGDVIGALVLLRAEVQGHFGAMELDRARTLGDLTSVALRRIRIVARARETRDALRKSEREQRILAETGRLLSSALDVQKTLDGLAHLLVEHLCDWCAIYLPAPGGARRAVLAGRDPDVEAMLASVAGEFLPGASNAIVIQVLRTGASALLAHVPEHLLTAAATGSPAYAHVLQTITPQSIVVVPLIARGRILGAIGLVSIDPARRYGDDDLELAEQVADRTALTIDNARLYEEAERRAREEAALRQATQAISASFTIEEIIQEIARSALVATDATGAFVERLSVDHEELEVVAAAGQHVPAVGLRVAFAGSSAERVIEHNQAEVIPDLGAAERLRPKALPEACSGCPAVVVPLVDAGQAIGALFLLRPPGAEGFRPDESERALTFAKLAALAFRKVDLLHTAQRRHEELEHVMESRARLMRGFGHDVRNPLGAADGFLELLEDGIMGVLTEQQRDGIHRARNLIHAALDLISDLLDLARAEAGQIDIQLQAVDVRDSVRELAGLYEAQAEAKRLSLDAHIPDDFPVTQSDSSRIRQILGNLLSNAVKYTDAGGIRVVLDIRSGDDAPGPGLWITVDVSDTGPGIPREMQSHIFQEFTRLASNGEGGAGIGLAISQRIAHALGGVITVRSAPGAGSTFTLWIPLTEV